MFDFLILQNIRIAVTDIYLKHLHKTYCSTIFEQITDHFYVVYLYWGYRKSKRRNKIELYLVTRH